MHVMDFKTLSMRSGITPRHLRYVLDHSLVPPRLLTEALPLMGRTRIVDEVSAVYIACAGHLLKAGFRGGTVRAMMAAFATNYVLDESSCPIFQEVVHSTQNASVQYGDGRYVRWIVERQAGEWQDPAHVGKGLKLVPRIYLEVDVGQISRAVRFFDLSRKRLDS
jgi:hypothetical protein